MATTSRVPKWFWWLTAALALTCLGGFGGVAWLMAQKFDVSFASRELENSAKEYREHGLPFTAADLEPSPPVKESENAAPLLRQAFKAFNYSRFNKERQQIATMVRSGKLENAHQALKRYGRGMSLAEQASHRPRIDWERNWDMGAMVLFPEYAQMKGFVHAFSLRADLRAQEGSPAAAIADLQTAFRLSNLSGQEPGLIAALVQTKCEAITLDASTRVGDALKGDPVALGLLKKALETPVSRPSLTSALPGEAYLAIATCRNLQHFRGGGRVKPESLQHDGFPTDTTQRAYMARALQFWTAADKLAKKFPAAPIRLAREIDALTNRLMKRNPQSQVLNATMIPPLSESGTALVRLDANWACTRALVWVLGEQAAGRRPSELPATFLDPFTNRPLKLLRSNNAVRVYSVGPDGRDNGGVDRSELPASLRDKAQWDVAASNPPVVRGNRRAVKP